MESKTITETKSAFLRSQIRLLSAPLQPSHHWRGSNHESEEGNISEKAVADVVEKVNEKIKQHSRMVYSAPSQRHVAEQIETLIWNDARHLDGRIDLETVLVKREEDLTNTNAIAALPEIYEDLHLNAEHINDEESSDEYLELRQQLLELSTLRDTKQAKLDQYKYLQNLLTSFENPQSNIQPNLVTRDGELSKELAKMRILLARVTGRIAEFQPSNSNEDSRESTFQNNEEKLRRIMQMT